MPKLIFLIIFVFSISTTPAYTYIGPGMSGGVIATVLGVVIAIFAALLGVLYYPIKRFIKNRKQKNATYEQK